MSTDTAISWADSTFNPWIGCTKISPACDHCYAARQDAFRKWTPEGWGGPRRRTSAALWKQPVKWNAVPFFECENCGLRTDAPMRAQCLGPHSSSHVWRPSRRRVFCASLADVFDNRVPPEWRGNLFELIRVTPNLDWLLLTKRPQNIIRMVREQGSIAGNGTRYLPDNVRLGTTCEDQARADINIPALLRTRAELGARSLFVSVEPMLGAVDLRYVVLSDSAFAVSADAPPEWQGIKRVRIGVNALRGAKLYDGALLDWVICGGESGPQARPMHPDWVRSLRDQCAGAGVPFHFKQWGEWGPYNRGAIDGGALATPYSLDHPLQRFGTKLAGRRLDGVEHNGFPS